MRIDDEALHNITVAPEFRDSAACDYHLSNGSPCIDAADDFAVLADDLDLNGDGIEGEPTPVDLDDRPRFVGVVDMGAYEFGLAGCPVAAIAASDPPDGTIDARQPHPIDDGSCGAWQGIGGAAEPIVITLAPAVSGADDPNCWALCETDARGCGANSIESVEYLGSEDYRLILARPITPGAVTTIQYLRHEGYVTYIAHPANVDGSGAANANDITALIDCLGPTLCTEYQEDIDHSGTANPNDITVLIDLLNGAQEFDPWYGTLLPEAEECPLGVVCGCDEGEGGAPEGGPEGSGDGGAEHFPDGFVRYLTNVNLEDPVEAECFPVIVAQLCNMSFRVLSVVERQELGRSLLDPELTFVSPWVEFVVPDIVAFLQSDEGDEQQE